MRRTLVASLFFFVLLLIWQILTVAKIWPPYLVPSPLDLFRYLIQSFSNGTMERAILVTLERLIFGYLSGVLIAIPLGLLVARYEFLEDTLGTLALGLQTLPSICWAPIAILWFGQSEWAMFFIVIMGCLWSILLATSSGVRHVPPLFIRAAETLGSKGLYTWTHVILPAAFPHILSGMKQGWAFAWRSLMAAEIYITILTGFGLGHLLHWSRELHAMDAVLAIMLIIILIGFFVDKLFFAPFENLVHRRWGTDKKAR